MDALVIPAGLIGGLAIAGFLVAVLAAAVTPVLSRFDRLAAWRGPLTLVPFGLLLVGALLAGVSTALGAVSTHSVGVREVATGALAVMCLTPIIGVAAVRLRYGAPGRRLFQQQSCWRHWPRWRCRRPSAGIASTSPMRRPSGSRATPRA